MSEVYRHPKYYALGYQWNTEREVAFIESCLKTYGAPAGKRPSSALQSEASGSAAKGKLLDIGCGAGRHLLELAKRGYGMTGIDASPEMIGHVREEAKQAGLQVAAGVGDLRQLELAGAFDAAFCFMDTFRFLLTNDQIVTHLKTVAGLLEPGGLYLTDFWVPSRFDHIGEEIYQWEQATDELKVRVFYIQHPETVDPIAQTFEDELVFEGEEGGGTREIRGGRTRTRLILPQEFEALIGASGAFTRLGTFADFDLAKPFTRESLSWRMISVLQKR